jgi:hypothetical protein
MSKPTNREEFREYILRALGHPLLKINVTEEQIDDRIEEALRIYYDYHFDGSEKVYYKHQITQEDINNKYIVMPDNINGVVNIFDSGMAMSSQGNMFNIRYQIALNDLYTLTSQSMLPYYMAFSHVQLLEQMLVGKKPIRYNRHTNKLYVDMSWENVNPGEFLLVEAYEVIDPELYTDAWNDRWLKEYCTALVKRQWGMNTSKYQGITMAGGVTFNGEFLYNEGKADEQRLREELERNAPVLGDLMG